MVKTRQKEKSTKIKSGDPGTDAEALSIRLKNFFIHYDVIFLFLVIFFCYNTVSIVTMSGDVIPAGILPLALIYDHSIFLDGPFVQGLFFGLIQSPDISYAIPEVNGHLVSFFPIVTPVLITPLYAIFSFLCWILNVPLTVPVAGAFAKSSASCITAASCALVYLTAKELFSSKTALITTFVYAFATSTWSVSSQALWQHGTVELLLILLIYCIVRNDRQPSRWTIILMGIASGLFVFNRPPDAVLLIPVLAYVAKECRDQAAIYAAACVAGGLPFLLYNIIIFGNVFGGYIRNTGLFHVGPDAVFGFISLLFSPNIGLFIFSPVLLIAVYGYSRVGTLTRPAIRDLLSLFGPVIILDVIVYSLFGSWFSSTAYSYGQRFLTGFIPVLALYLGIVFRDLFTTKRKDNALRLVQGCFILLIVLSVFIQAVGVFLYPFNPVKSMEPSDVWDTGHLIIVDSYHAGLWSITSIKMLNIPPLPPVFQIPIHL